MPRTTQTIAAAPVDTVDKVFVLPTLEAVALRVSIKSADGSSMEDLTVALRKWNGRDVDFDTPISIAFETTAPISHSKEATVEAADMVGVPFVALVVTAAAAAGARADIEVTQDVEERQ